MVQVCSADWRLPVAEPPLWLTCDPSATSLQGLSQEARGRGGNTRTAGTYALGESIVVGTYFGSHR